MSTRVTWHIRHIWPATTSLILMLQIFGQRPWTGQVKGSVCLRRWRRKLRITEPVNSVWHCTADMDRCKSQWYYETCVGTGKFVFLNCKFFPSGNTAAYHNDTCHDTSGKVGMMTTLGGVVNSALILRVLWFQWDTLKPQYFQDQRTVHKSTLHVP